MATEVVEKRVKAGQGLETLKLAGQITPRAVVGSDDPKVPTPELRDFFEPQLRAKEHIERRADVKLAVMAFMLYHIGLVGWVLYNSGSTPALLWKLGALLCATYGSDLFTGFLHIYLDHRRCDLGDPLDMAAYSFRYDHHAYPGNFNKDNVFLPAGSGEIVAFIATPVSILMHSFVYASGGLVHDSTSELKALCLCVWIVTGGACQMTHSLAHEGISGRNKSCPNLIRFLQKSHIILPPMTHGGHHKGDHDCNFCIFNGWANPLLNTIKPAVFWAMRKCPGHFDIRAVPGGRPKVD